MGTEDEILEEASKDSCFEGTAIGVRSSAGDKQAHEEETRKKSTVKKCQTPQQKSDQNKRTNLMTYRSWAALEELEPLQVARCDLAQRHQAVFGEKKSKKREEESPGLASSGVEAVLPLPLHWPTSVLTSL